MTRIVNQAGQDLTKFFEGVKLARYVDSAGNATIGIGHKITPNDNIGDTITQAQCDQLFEKDLAYAASEVERLTGDIKLTDNQFAALVDFTFNLGAGCFQTSTLLRYILEGNYADAAEQFERWIYADYKISDGLQRRRVAERELFEMPDNS